MFINNLSDESIVDMSLPYQLSITIDLPDAMQWYAVSDAGLVDKIEIKMIIAVKINFPERHLDHAVFFAVIVKQPKIATAKFVIPSNPVQ